MTISKESLSKLTWRSATLLFALLIGGCVRVSGGDECDGRDGGAMCAPRAPASGSATPGEGQKDPSKSPDPPDARSSEFVYPIEGVKDMRLTRIDRIEGVDSSFVIHFTGNPCSGVLGRLDLDETTNQVTVGVWTGYHPDFTSERDGQNFACTMEGRFYKTSLSLDAPLGGRTVIDKYDNRSVDVVSR